MTVNKKISAIRQDVCQWTKDGNECCD